MEKNVDIGRIGENIVTSEFLARGFLVTHLDKGTRGVSANADLLVGHPQLARPILIQVKSCHTDPSPDWVFIGSLSDRVLMGDEPVYNRKPGFKADILAAVAVTGPRNYRSFILPVNVAEEIALTAYRGLHGHPTKAGQQRKVIPKMYISVNREKVRRTRAHPRVQELMGAASESLLKFEDAYERLLTAE